ncbi:translocation/assembly module TamB domain-containing protein [Siphonobacter aquaeclarae]|uniref:AsmA family protein n=1 Tax=Siphonobacter aquaeclarae TaxID=563176 RepID=A0A1G9PZH7_9BACT|nr:translocation/assembly module TamB domain-containing protein [Siphonobacter aquaeclarae]SDM04176.1 AsmA family protein [Siphonobacter aquaeclarae]
MNIKKTINYTLAAIGALLLVLVAFLLILGTTSWGQQFVTRQVNNYLKGKLNAPFSIGRISYHIPDWIQLDDVYFGTPKGDTLLSGKRLRVDLDMLGLLQSKVALNQIELDKIRLDIRRTLPDTTFNFQYLIDAFSSGKPADPADTASAPLALSLSGIALNDVQVRYHDDVAGADVTVLLDTLKGKFDEVDIAKSRYHVNEVRSGGLSVKARIYPGIPSTAPAAPSNPADSLDLRIGDWKLSRTAWDVRVEDAHFATKGKAGYLAVAGDQLYLNGQQVNIRSLELLNADVSASMQKAPAAAGKKAAEPSPATEGGWKASLGRVRLAGNRIWYDDENAPRQAKGMDYAHLDVRGLTLAGEQLVYQPDRISGSLRRGSFTERSGLNLRRLDADVTYTPKGISLTRFLLQTPGTELKDRLIIRYDSLGQLMRAGEAHRVTVDARLTRNKLSFADVLLLAPGLADTPPFKGNEKEVLTANLEAKGTLAALRLPQAEFTMLSGTKIKAKGQVSYPTDPARMGLDLTIDQAATTSADIRRLLPKGTLPDSVSIPPQMQLTGTAKGKLNALRLDAALNTVWGNAAFDGTLNNFVTGKNQQYTGTAKLEQFDLGKWLGQPKVYGPVTATATVDGKGIDPKTMATTFDVDIPEVTYNGYRYQLIKATGNLDNGTLHVTGGINDPNARLSLNADANMATTYPSVKGKVDIGTLDLHALKFYADPLKLNGNVVMDFASTNPDSLIGRLAAEDLKIQLNGKQYPVDSLYLKAGVDGSARNLIARTPFAEIDLGGHYTFSNLAAASLSEINKYVTLPMEVSAPTAPTDFSLKMRVRQHPLLLAFVPGLTRLEPVKIEATLDSKRADSTLNISVTAGPIEYDTMLVAGANLKLVTKDGKLALNGEIGEVKTQSLHAFKTGLAATATDNRVRFAVMNRDSLGKDRYGLAGQVLVQGTTYQMNLDQKGLLTNYRFWSADTSGFIRYGKEGVQAEKFSLSTKDQSITVNSTEPRPNAPLRVEAKNLILTDLAKLANQDSLLVAGVLNGDVIVKDYLGEKRLSFTGDIRVDSLEVMQKALGNLEASFANTDDNRIKVETALHGTVNDIHVGGYYNPTSTAQALDLDVDLKRLDTRTIEAFSFGQLRRAKGQLTGQIKVNGAVDKPKLKGEVNFDSVSFNLTFINATYALHKEKVTFDNQVIRFDKFDITDSLGRTLTTDGTVDISTLPNAAYNLSISSKKFSVLSASRKDNDLVYGNATLTANLRVRGRGTSPAVSGDLKVDDGSNVTLILPDTGPEAGDAAGIVTFIQPNDTTALMSYLRRPAKDSLNTRIRFDQLTNSNISLNLEVNEKSELTIIVDPLTGDYLRAKGNARLNMNLDAAGNLGLYGRYDVTEGGYLLNYEGVLRKQFQIQKGSSITFSGDPMKADMDVTAIYRVNARPYDLIGSETGTSGAGSSSDTYLLRNKMPFDVALMMKGNLSAPNLSFDIRQPTTANAGLANETSSWSDRINKKLSDLRQDQSLVNRQVFALLVLGNFFQENSFDFFSSGAGGGAMAENVARNSVSKILSEQLNRLASSVIKGVDLNVNLASGADYVNNTGGAGARTDLNVGLSKSFMNGRLSVSVGKNFVLENTTGVQNPNEVFDNVSLNYSLTRDGRYMVRAYRKNQLQSVLEGYIVETGIGFAITIDYNAFKDLFSKSAKE